MVNYIKIEIQVTSSEQSEILIAELSEINFDAFEENENSLSAFIKEEYFNEDELQKIISVKNISYTKTIIAETNWNAKWESEFQPIIVENFVAIRAGFHKPVTNVKHEIIITPKMSFGTGHHATTYLMLQQMQDLNFTGKTVLDFGTGTGILAVMGKKLGAEKVVAIDNDEWSINNAAENFDANNCPDIILQLKDNLNGLETFDIILANINLNVIAKNIGGFKIVTHASSQLLLSGFLQTDEQTLKNSFISAGFEHVVTIQRNGWISMLITKS
jgi:ribosomal protein L11 methyltransferase